MSNFKKVVCTLLNVNEFRLSETIWVLGISGILMSSIQIPTAIYLIM
jgi:hypothetical protein